MTENLLYPSGGWHGDKGVLVAAYVSAWIDQDNPRKFTALSHDGTVPDLPRGGRTAASRQGRRADPAGDGGLGPDPLLGRRRPGRPALVREPAPGPLCGAYRPEGPIFFAGEHLSYVQFWQEGAALSSHEAMKALQARVQEKALTGRAARRAMAA